MKISILTLTLILSLTFPALSKNDVDRQRAEMVRQLQELKAGQQDFTAQSGSPEYMKMIKESMDVYSLAAPEMKDALKALNTAQEYNTCLDKKLGHGANHKITQSLMQKDVMMSIKDAIDNANIYCKQNKRSQAQQVIDDTTNALLKRRFSSFEISAMKKCSKNKNYKLVQMHPCDL
jgi:hypothetical protein